MNGRDSEAGEAAVRDLSGQGGEIAFVAGDVGRAADCERLAAETASRFGGIDVVCANAGVKLADMTEEDIDSIVATNVKGCMLTVKALVKGLFCVAAMLLRGSPVALGPLRGPSGVAPPARPLSPSFSVCVDALGDDGFAHIAVGARRRRPTHPPGVKNRSNGAKNTGSSNKASTRASSIDSRRSSFGKNRSQNVG